MSHTPGPWKPVVDDDLHPIAFLDDGEHRWLGEVYGPFYGMPEAECLANAALIAAAPDLLKCCQNALADAESRHRKGERVNPYLCEDLRAAIAKATGKEPT